MSRFWNWCVPKEGLIEHFDSMAIYFLFSMILSLFLSDFEFTFPARQGWQQKVVIKAASS